MPFLSPNEHDEVRRELEHLAEALRAAIAAEADPERLARLNSLLDEIQKSLLWRDRFERTAGK